METLVEISAATVSDAARVPGAEDTDDGSNASATWLEYLLSSVVAEASAPAPAPAPTPTPPPTSTPTSPPPAVRTDLLIALTVLPDGSTLNLGYVTYRASDNAYCDEAGAVHIPRECQSSDGLFHADSGTYRLVRACEFDPSVHARSPPSRPPPPPPPPPPPTSPDQSQREPTHRPRTPNPPTDMTTVFIGPSNVACVMKQIEPIVALAGDRGNVVVVVVLGATTDEDARAALDTPLPRDARRVCMVGRRELARFVEAPSETFHRYMRRALLVDCLVDPFSKARTWVFGAGSPVDGKTPLAAMPATPPSSCTDEDRIAWKCAVNEQFRRWVERVGAKDGGLDADANAALQTVYLGRNHSEHLHEPLSRMKWSPPDVVRSDECAMGWDAAAPFAILSRAWQPYEVHEAETTSVRHDWLDRRNASIAHLPTGGACSGWAVATTCGALRVAMCPAMLPIDRSVGLHELQYDVSTVVMSLLAYTTAEGTRPFYQRCHRLRGLTGPCVLGGREASETMRLSWWWLEADDTDDRGVGVVLIFPEAYIRLALADCNVHRAIATPTPTMSVASVLTLPHTSTIPMEFGDVTPDELDDTRDYFGRRAWLVPRLPSHPPALATPAHAFPALESSPYRTPNEADDAIAHRIGQPLEDGHATTWCVSTNDADSLTGLHVRLVLAPGAEDMPALDLCLP